MENTSKREDQHEFRIAPPTNIEDSKEAIDGKSTPAVQNNESSNNDKTKLEIDSDVIVNGKSSPIQQLDNIITNLEIDSELIVNGKSTPIQPVSSIASNTVTKPNRLKSQEMSDENWLMSGFCEEFVRRERVVDEQLQEIVRAMFKNDPPRRDGGANYPSSCSSSDSLEELRRPTMEENEEVRRRILEEHKREMAKYKEKHGWETSSLNEFGRSDWSFSDDSSLSADERSIFWSSTSDEEPSGPQYYGYFDEDYAQEKYSPSEDTPRCSTGERRFKVLIIGDAGVGKTSIIKKYCINAALGDYRATIGMDYFSKKLILEDNTQVYLHIWDIAGGGRLGTMTRLIYRGAHGAMVVCDATRRVTIQNAVRWKDDLDEKTCLPDGGPIPCVFLANKCDLEVNSVVRNDSEMKRYCMKNRLLTWFETSAKDGTGIKEAFDLLAKEMMKNKRDDFGMTQPEVIRLSSETTTMKKKSKCLCS